MEFCILGLLLLGDRSLYELNREFAERLGLFYSASLGSLQKTLVKLEAKGWIEGRTEATGKRTRRVFRLLGPGVEAFHRAWDEPISPTKLEVTALSRLYFLGTLPDQAARRRALGQILEAIGPVLAHLEATSRALEEIKVPAEYETVFHYQKATLGYGLGAHRFALEFFGNLAGEIEKERE